MVSAPTSMDAAAVAQAPTGVLMGPALLSSSMLIQAGMVLMNVSCSTSPSSCAPSARSRNTPRRLYMPPMPLPTQLPTSLTCTYWGGTEMREEGPHEA